MTDVSELIKAGQERVFRELGLDKDQLKLLGKLTRLEMNEKVNTRYDPTSRFSGMPAPRFGGRFHVTFYKDIDEEEFKWLLKKYDINPNYRLLDKEAMLDHNPDWVQVTFSPVLIEEDPRKTA